MATGTEARFLEPSYVAAQLSQVTDTDPAVATSSLAWVLVGVRSNRNISQGPFSATSMLGANCFFNRFGFGFNSCVLGAGSSGNVFESVQNNHILGTSFFANRFAASCSDVRFGASCQFNEVGSGVNLVRAGDNCTGNYLAGGVAYVTLGNNVKGCKIEQGCSAVALGNGCERVELYNCGNSDYTAPFVVPAGTKDAVYRNNVLQGTGGGSGGAAPSAVPFGPLTATGNPGETFALPVGTKSVRAVLVYDLAPDFGQHPVIGFTANMYTLDTTANPPTLTVAAGYELDAGDTIEGIAFTTGSTSGTGGSGNKGYQSTYTETAPEGA